MNTKLENNTTTTHENAKATDHGTPGLLERRSFLRGDMNVSAMTTAAGKAIKAAAQHNLMAFRSSNFLMLGVF